MGCGICKQANSTQEQNNESIVEISYNQNISKASPSDDKPQKVCMKPPPADNFDQEKPEDKSASSQIKTSAKDLAVCSCL